MCDPGSSSTLRDLRVARGWSRGVMATTMGAVTRGAILRWECGVNRPRMRYWPRLRVLFDLDAAALDAVFCATEQGPWVPLPRRPDALASERQRIQERIDELPPVAGSISYQRQYRRCNRAACHRCPHGPYWYAYWRDAAGQKQCRYIGRYLPTRAVSTTA